MKRFGMLMLLAGCAGFPGAPVPQAARLSADVLTVTLSDATVCRADWVQAPSGTLENCAGLGYVVTVEPNPNPLRVIMQELVQAIGAQSAQPPMAEVVLTDASGRVSRFVSPPPIVE
jgi:hypothetical protein